ncbi:MAG: thiol:disulfide interchange protein DsbA/DsbL [Betaproteobacteria bacterium]|nr:thiol:disulfide interchange protein DsbA/DsbL [Betaproteobacteria bacterium]
MPRTIQSLSRLLTVLLALVTGFANAQEPQEGRHYQRIKNAQPVETGKKIEVIEFFSYGCPHCASLEPFISPWSKKLPADVQFRRVPVLFQTPWINLAKIYFTLETLGVEERYSQAVFDALHRERVAIHQEPAFLDWAAKKGLDREKVAGVFASFSVNSSVSRARAQGAAYRVQGVPMIIVDGKFMTDVEMNGGNEQMLRVVEQLITKARAERGTR